MIDNNPFQNLSLLARLALLLDLCPLAIALLMKYDGWGAEEEMTEDDRVRAVREVRKMTTEQLLEWRVKRAPDDSFRNGIVDWDLKSRSNKTAIITGLLGTTVGSLLTWALGHWF
jgi:hypothetical protein